MKSFLLLGGTEVIKITNQFLHRSQRFHLKVINEVNFITFFSIKTFYSKCKTISFIQTRIFHFFFLCIRESHWVCATNARKKSKWKKKKSKNDKKKRKININSFVYRATRIVEQNKTEKKEKNIVLHRAFEENCFFFLWL